MLEDVRVLVFDMDDTLYRELDYVFGGFAAVAAFLAERFESDPARLLEQMKATLNLEGRGRVFDRALAFLGVPASAGLVRECLAVYRGHSPRISLFPAADRCLSRFSEWPIYVVTDGNRAVQRRKAEALGLFDRVKRVCISHDFGRDKAKPNPYLFQKIAAWEGVEPTQVVYVGDNPNKDFCGIKPLGFQTVRIRFGMFADVTLDDRHEADFEIADLDQLCPALSGIKVGER